MEGLGEENLVVNGNIGKFTCEEVEIKKKKTVFGKMVGMKAGKLGEGEEFSLL